MRTGDQPGQTTTLAPDWQNTVRHQIDNQTGELRTSLQTPYGAERGQTPTGWAGERGFVGGTKDATGLTRIGARDYDPLLERFITVDPVQDPDEPLQWNAYLYANNTPLAMSDPSGKRPIIDDGAVRYRAYQARRQFLQTSLIWSKYVIPSAFTGLGGAGKGLDTTGWHRPQRNYPPSKALRTPWQTPPRRAIEKAPIAKEKGRPLRAVREPRKLVEAKNPKDVKLSPSAPVKWLKRMGPVGTAIGAAATGYENWDRLSNAGYSGGELAARTVGYTAVSTAASWAGSLGGAKAGAWIGATIGIAFGPLGVIVGGVAGGIIGGVLGGLAGGWLGDAIVNKAEERW
jgi:RHS repeat-associated protein